MNIYIRILLLNLGLFVVYMAAGMWLIVMGIGNDIGFTVALGSPLLHSALSGLFAYLMREDKDSMMAWLLTIAMIIILVIIVFGSVFAYVVLTYPGH